MPGVAQRVGRDIALLFHDRGTRRGVSGQQHAPAALYPQGKIRYPFYRRLGGPQNRSGRAENLVPTGIRSRTVQPVAQSLYRLSYPAVSRFIFEKSSNFKFLENPSSGDRVVLCGRIDIHDEANSLFFPPNFANAPNKYKHMVPL